VYPEHIYLRSLSVRKDDVGAGQQRRLRVLVVQRGDHQQVWQNTLLAGSVD
jgi:hypothetical protein